MTFKQESTWPRRHTYLFTLLVLIGNKYQHTFSVQNQKALNKTNFLYPSEFCQYVILFNEGPLRFYIVLIFVCSSHLSHGFTSGIHGRLAM